MDKIIGISQHIKRAGKKDFPARLAFSLLIIAGSGIMSIWKGKMIL